MLTFVFGRGPVIFVGAGYDLGVRVSDERVPLGEFKWSGTTAAVSCTEYPRDLLVHVAHGTHPAYRTSPGALSEMHCRVLDSTGRPLHFLGLHRRFFEMISWAGGTSNDWGLVFSTRGQEMTRARVIVTTDEGDFEMTYEPAASAPNTPDASPAPPPGEGESRREGEGE